MDGPLAVLPEAPHHQQGIAAGPIAPWPEHSHPQSHLMTPQWSPRHLFPSPPLPSQSCCEENIKDTGTQAASRVEEEQEMARVPQVVRAQPALRGDMVPALSSETCTVEPEWGGDCYLLVPQASGSCVAKALPESAGPQRPSALMSPPPEALRSPTPWRAAASPLVDTSILPVPGPYSRQETGRFSPVWPLAGALFFGSC